MHFTFNHPIPLDPDQVVQFMCDEAFQAEKAARVGAQKFSMTCHQDQTNTTVRTERHLPTVGLPEFVKALVRPVMVVAETERWEAPTDDGHYTGEFEIDVDGAPVKFRGRVSVTPAHDGSLLTFEGELSATVPLFRARVEEASAAQIRETMQTESDLLTQHANTGATTKPA